MRNTIEMVAQNMANYGNILKEIVHLNSISCTMDYQIESENKMFYGGPLLFFVNFCNAKNNARNISIILTTSAYPSHITTTYTNMRAVGRFFILTGVKNIGNQVK